jgi:anti-anti-sigma factor
MPDPHPRGQADCGTTITVITQAKAATMPSDPPTLLLTVTVLPGRRRTDVVLSGEVDVAARPVLAAVVDRLADAAPDTTVVDLAAVVFGGSVLASFLASVRAAIPAGSQLVLARPKPMTHKVLRLTGMDQIGVIRNSDEYVGQTNRRREATCDRFD